MNEVNEINEMLNNNILSDDDIIIDVDLDGNDETEYIKKIYEQSIDIISIENEQLKYLKLLYKQNDNMNFWFKDSFTDLLAEQIDDSNIDLKDEIIESKKDVEPESKDIKSTSWIGDLVALGTSLALLTPMLMKFGEKLGGSLSGLNDRINDSIKANKEWDKAFKESIEMQKKVGEIYNSFIDNGTADEHDKAVKLMKKNALKFEGQSLVTLFRLRGQEGDIYSDAEWGADINLPDLFTKQLLYIAEHFDEFKDDEDIKKYYMNEIKKMENTYSDFDDTDTAQKMFEDYILRLKAKRSELSKLSATEIDRKLMWSVKRSQSGKLTDEQKKMQDKLDMRYNKMMEYIDIGFTSEEAERMVDIAEPQKDVSIRGVSSGRENGTGILSIPNVFNNKLVKLSKVSEKSKINEINNDKSSVNNIDKSNVNNVSNKTTIINQGKTIINIDKQEIFGDKNGRL